MKPTVSQYAHTLRELSREASPSECQSIAKNFLKLLRQKKETKKWPLILKKVEALEAWASGTVPMRVTTARSLGERERGEIEALAKSLFETQEVMIEYWVDESVQGGAVFRTDEQMIDASVRGKLKRLHQALLQ